ncbi:hypothetical protein QBC36DRAFT_341099 [Triangularia setosa]|uniref:C-type lectin domain-containing protein n=1 Tax=Triangularia setosa TaxID=2587417 RepID=A0AAN6VX72_9PEZI|nr:hypothetical protein QBC36DRAFT_341099 [Podospora setosa]
MFSSPSLNHRLLLLLLVSSEALAQTSTVKVIPTPVTWYNALAACEGSGDTLYPVPATTTDPVYAVLQNRPEDRFWIARRRGGSCTSLNKNSSGDLLEEAPCEDLLPAVCKI